MTPAAARRNLVADATSHLPRRCRHRHGLGVPDRGGGDRLLVVCGIFQGGKELRLRNWRAPSFDPATVPALILTHTHLDHIGRVPRLVSRLSRTISYSAVVSELITNHGLNEEAHHRVTLKVTWRR